MSARGDVFLGDVFLSARLPIDDASHEEELDELDDQRDTDAYFHRIREAVAHCCQFALTRGYGIVTTAEPTTIGIAMEALRGFRRRGGRTAPARLSILAGRPSGYDDDVQLERVPRPQRVHWGRLKAVVLVGGNRDTFEDANAAIRESGLHGKRFAIASTGRVVADLLARHRSSLHGHSANLDLLSRELNYTVVMRRIFEDIDPSAASSAPPG